MPVSYTHLVNPIHEKTDEYNSSKEEIDEAIEAGADLLMLPYFKTGYQPQPVGALGPDPADPSRPAGHLEK